MEAWPDRCQVSVRELELENCEARSERIPQRLFVGVPPGSRRKRAPTATPARHRACWVVEASVVAGVGFAAVIVVGQSTMRTMVRALYMTNKIKHVLAVSVPLPGGFGTLTGQPFVGLPIVRFRDRGDDTISIDVHM